MSGVRVSTVFNGSPRALGFGSRSDAKLTVASVYAFFDFAAEPEPAKAYALIDRAAALGAKTVLVVPGFVSPTATSVERQRAAKPSDDFGAYLGFIALHSAHHCKPLKAVLGTGA